jgi:NAD(P)-dependent dehydrogenase (short-subunit alcohol dehydrogenase family)
VEARGGQAVAAPADVANPEDLERVAQVAQDRFGGFDTWINNAAAAVYGAVEQIPIEDHRRVFEVNYWGVVNGSLIAARHLRRRGGAIINTGSVVSDRAVILQGPYSAAKHAVKAFTDTLRMEIEQDDLIKPSAIDTTFFEHARSYLDAPGIKNPPPAYDPALVAKAMLYACEHPKRDIVIGFGGWAISALGAVAPRATDYVMEAAGRAMQVTDHPGRRQRRDNLYEPREDGSAHSALPGREWTRQTSLFLEAQLHPVGRDRRGSGRPGAGDRLLPAVRRRPTHTRALTPASKPGQEAGYRSGRLRSVSRNPTRTIRRP